MAVSLYIIVIFNKNKLEIINKRLSDIYISILYKNY